MKNLSPATWAHSVALIFVFSSPQPDTSLHYKTTDAVTGRRIREDACPRLSKPGWTTATWYSLVHRGLSLTDSSGYWTLLHVLSAERASTTVDCRSCNMPTCTGSMWQVEFGTNSPSQSTGVSTTRRQSTWQSVVSLSRISLVVSDCAQHTVASWMYRAIDEHHSAVGRSLSLDQPSGIRFQTSLEKRLKTLSGCHWKRRFSDNICVFSASVVFTTMRYINRRFTYLLTGLMHRMMWLFTPQRLLVLTSLIRRGWPGRVGLGGWLHTEMVQSLTDVHPSQYYLSPTTSNPVDRDHLVITKPRRHPRW